MNVIRTAVEVCKSKRQYRTEKIAATAALKVRRMLAKDQEPYQCPVCGLWHLATDKRKAAVKRAMLGGGK